MRGTICLYLPCRPCSAHNPDGGVPTTVLDRGQRVSSLPGERPVPRPFRPEVLGPRRSRPESALAFAAGTDGTARMAVVTKRAPDFNSAVEPRPPGGETPAPRGPAALQAESNGRHPATRPLVASSVLVTAARRSLHPLSGRAVPDQDASGRPDHPHRWRQAHRATDRAPQPESTSAFPEVRAVDPGGSADLEGGA